ncbi:hypothetical protein N665_3128s0002 [Sinapis alba]|nr:hypothetical protein N665_3128s0002 [Sinapis alba]
MVMLQFLISRTYLVYNKLLLQQVNNSHFFFHDSLNRQSGVPTRDQRCAAPEYHLRNHSGVYSFRVVLYEIIMERRTIKRMQPSAENVLLEWIEIYHADSKSFRMIFESTYHVSMLRRVAKVADHCLKNDKTDPL